MQEQLPVLPAVGADDDSVANGHSARSVGDDLGAPRRVGQFWVVGKWNAIDHQHPDPGRILHSGAAGIGQLVGSQGGAMFENVGFLPFRPLVSEGRKALKFFLVDHTAGLAGLDSKQVPCKRVLLSAGAELTGWGLANPVIVSRSGTYLS